MGKLIHRSTEWLTYVLLLNVIIALVLELCLLAPYAAASKFSQDAIDDNEFAEFEEIEDDSEEFVGQAKAQQTPQPVSPPPPVNTQTNKKIDESDGLVEEEDDEFEVIPDVDESEKM